MKLFGVIGNVLPVLAILFAAAPASAAGFPEAQVGAETSIPFGWVDFCARYRGECADDDRAPEDIAITPAAWRKILQVNAYVNAHIEPVSDKEQWDVIDRWDYPSAGAGDCEDYALLKRRMLIEAGFPRQALLLTVVKEQNGDGHSVLTVRTSRGEYVLDNLSREVKPWTETPYRFVKRQSQTNPNVWVALGAPTSEPAYVSK